MHLGTGTIEANHMEFLRVINQSQYSDETSSSEEEDDDEAEKFQSNVAKSQSKDARLHLLHK